jgi:hypothetical protein
MSRATTHHETGLIRVNTELGLGFLVVYVVLPFFDFEIMVEETMADVVDSTDMPTLATPRLVGTITSTVV